MNSTHAAWINGAALAALGALQAIPQASLPPWAITIIAMAVLGLNTLAHATLPDAPK